MPNKKRKKGSLQYRVLLCFTLMLALLIGVTLLMNLLFLDSFYQGKKTKTLTAVFESLNTKAANGSLYTDGAEDDLEQLVVNNNITLVVVKNNYDVEITTAPDSDRLIEQVQNMLIGGDSSEDREVLEETGQYTVVRMPDMRFNEDYIILVGFLDDGNIIMMKTPLESIHEAVSLSNEFLAYAGGLALIVSIILSFVFTRVITRPITEITQLSERMSNLDFSAKYTSSDRHDEVDDLGEHMNELSSTLETAIGELKEANVQLQNDLDMKDAAEKMRRDFIGNVSHELKTPIAVIQGYAEGLQEGVADDPESLTFYTETIIDEAKRMNRMVQQMLSLNKLEYGETQISMERFNLTETIKSVIASQQILAADKNITILFDESSPTFVWADAFMAEQVISNFLSNAIHYCSGENKIQITFTMKEKCVRVGVFNSGDPIPEESIPHLWEKFYKVDKARTREYGGSGIGLSIVKAIMDSFGQECGVTNYENGVEFWCEFDTVNV